MVPSIQLKTVLLAQIPKASISTAVRANPGLLRSCRKAKRTSWSSPAMRTPPQGTLLLGNKSSWTDWLHAVRQSTDGVKWMTGNEMRCGDGWSEGGCGVRGRAGCPISNTARRGFSRAALRVLIQWHGNNLEPF